MDPEVSDTQLDQAVEILHAGGLVAFPTETVYGIGADASNPLAVRRVFAAKQRPVDHPVIVHLGTIDQLDQWAHACDRAQALARQFWPGPLTMVLPRRKDVPDEVTGGLDTVGIRIPSHPVALRLLDAFGGALAAPSANRFGEVSPTRAEHVRHGLGDDLLVLDGGPCQVGIESSIVDLTVDPPALLRPGGIAPEILEGVLGPLGTSHTRAPGTLPSHYAPRTALRVTDQPENEVHHLEQQGLRVAVLRARPPAEYAQVLYAELRRLDAMGVDVLVAERVAEYGLGLAINDRLERASHSRDR